MIAVLLAAAAVGTAHASEPQPDAEAQAQALPLPDYQHLWERHGTVGFRTGIPAGGSSASTRVALVQDFDGPTIGELTLRGQVTWARFGVAVEVVGTGGVSGAWRGLGAGNVLLDARLVTGRVVTHALGLRGTLPVGDRHGAHGPVSWWGTVPDATVPMAGAAFAYDGATPRWVWHVHLGLRLADWLPLGLVSVIDVGTSVATIQPITTGWDVVVELEALNTASPVHVRALARRDLGRGWEADLGLAVPVAVFFQDPTLQVLGRLERRW